MTIFDRFVGIPYADRGRSSAGCDCYGLLRLVMAELRGVDLPAMTDFYVTSADLHAIAALIEGGLEAWDRVPPGREQAFDGVLMRRGRDIRHIGIVVDRGRLLHVDQDETSRIERYTMPPLAQRVVGFYRYRNAPFAAGLADRVAGSGA